MVFDQSGLDYLHYIFDCLVLDQVADVSPLVQTHSSLPQQVAPPQKVEKLGKRLHPLWQLKRVGPALSVGPKEARPPAKQVIEPLSGLVSVPVVFHSQHHQLSQEC